LAELSKNKSLESEGLEPSTPALCEQSHENA
jgi:hypothetical protein